MAATSDPIVSAIIMRMMVPSMPALPMAPTIALLSQASVIHDVRKDEI